MSPTAQPGHLSWTMACTVLPSGPRTVMVLPHMGLPLDCTPISCAETATMCSVSSLPESSKPHEPKPRSKYVRSPLYVVDRGLPPPLPSPPPTVSVGWGAGGGGGGGGGAIEMVVVVGAGGGGGGGSEGFSTMGLWRWKKAGQFCFFPRRARYKDGCCRVSGHTEAAAAPPWEAPTWSAEARAQVRWSSQAPQPARCGSG